MIKAIQDETKTAVCAMGEGITERRGQHADQPDRHCSRRMVMAELLALIAVWLVEEGDIGIARIYPA